MIVFTMNVLLFVGASAPQNVTFSKDPWNINVSWSQPDGIFDKVVIDLCNASASETKEVKKDENYRTAFTNLTPGSMYTITLITFKEDQNSTANVQNVYTTEISK